MCGAAGGAHCGSDGRFSNHGCGAGAGSETVCAEQVAAAAKEGVAGGDDDGGG